MYIICYIDYKNKSLGCEVQSTLSISSFSDKLALGRNRSRTKDAFNEGENMYGEDHRTDDLQKSQEKQQQIAIQSEWCSF